MSDPVLSQLRGSPEVRRAALVALYRELGPRIRRHALHKKLPPDVASDVVQQVFERLLSGVGSFRGESLFTTWVWGIANNVIREQYRQRHMQPLPDDGPDSEADDGTHEHKPRVQPELSYWPAMEDEVCMQKALAAFAGSYPERALMIEFLVDGWSITELAQYLGRTEGATRQYLSECRKKLAPYVQACRDCEPGTPPGSRRKERP